VTVGGGGGKPAESLRWRLLRLVMLSTVLAWALAAALSYRQALDDVQELMDSQMAETARLLIALAQNAGGQRADLPKTVESPRSKRSRRGELAQEFRIVRADGSVLLRSARDPELPLDTSLGYADVTVAGSTWRSLVLESADGSLRAQVTHPAHSRNREAFEIASNAALPPALLLLPMLALIYFSVCRGLKPLEDLAAGVAARSPENLTALPVATAPRETTQLIEALNQLLARLTAALDNERRFTADAAHELRTPLAALKIQAQIAVAAPDSAQQRHALAQVLAGADRAARLVEQLLRLARLDPIVKLPHPQPIDLAGLARAWADESRPAAAGKTVDVVASSAPVTVEGDRDLLAVAARNLVDNALRYAPAGSTVTLRAGLEHGEPVLVVADNGPGVPEEELQHLLERFYRGRDVTAEGSGLGLAIVHRIAELHGAVLEVENVAGGGFAARLRWRAAGRRARERSSPGGAPAVGRPEKGW
jgi:two-component system sensor histidine kinase QseC